MDLFFITTEAAVEWISRPRSTLFVNAGETAKIDWRFPSGARLITYKKKSTIFEDGITIAFKKGSVKPEILSATKSIIRIEDSGALSILKAGLKDEGYYAIDIVYNMGITLKDEVRIKIQEAPAITTFPTHAKSEIFYVGITINLLCMAKGRPVPKVQWFKDNSDSPLKESSGSILYQIKSASNEDSGKYTCLATNRAGKAKRTIEYIIYRRPYVREFFHNTALDGTIYEGESVRLTCSAKGNPPITYYKLLHNGKEIAKSSSGKYVIEEVKFENNGTYSCIPINKAGQGENKTLVLYVLARPGYWEEKLKKTTSPPTVKKTTAVTNDKTTHADTTEIPSIVTHETPTQVQRGTGIIVKENIFLSTLLLLLAEIIKLTA
ncbi:hemicentin-1-like isoform X2 [Dendronephthya gigantea]|uniref:hemicentin-1-like isoform X2 n=1 Tax=Dendronephthya gigantea TaxID=151771 RepID=UPI00106BA76C|nr:hemicentin-1-like isoform X2 [Dendronephthya gigantea]